MGAVSYLIVVLTIFLLEFNWGVTEIYTVTPEDFQSAVNCGDNGIKQNPFKNDTRCILKIK